jgi:hypothetical protein
MSNSKRWLSIEIGSTLAVLLLVGVLTMTLALAQGPGGRMGGSGSGNGGFGPGGMMGNTQGFTGTSQFGPGGMMGNSFNGDGDFAGMMGGGMMVNPNNAFYTAPTPLTLEEASTVLEAYLADLNDSNLTYKDIMIFDNHTYAQIVEKDSGTGVLEVLIDPTSKAVYPEMGPNMMWNQKYGMMSGYGRYGMMGGMMGNSTGAVPPSEPTVTPEQAVTAAQTYLDTNFATAGLTANKHANPMSGYYTLDVNRDDQPVGMLSVNGYTGAVWPHTWHGKLLAMGAEE